MNTRRAARLVALPLLLSACSSEPGLDTLFGGRWSVTDHQEAIGDCDAFAPADPPWSEVQIDFIDLEGVLGVTVSHCEGGCDPPNVAVPLDEATETRLAGLDVEAGLFPGKKEDVCQASIANLVASLDEAGAFTLDVRTFFGSVPPPADGDCDAEVIELVDELCDAALHIEAER